MMPEPEATAKQFRVGTKLGDLDTQFEGWKPSSTEVDAWEPASEPKTEGQSDALLANEFGEFRETHLGSYEEWNAPASEREKFQGTITLYHYSWVVPDDIKPSFSIELTYINGTLRNVGVGILPG